jgi:hypothetical protein
MSKFQMFDSVTLNQDIQLHSGGTAPQGTDGAIVEIFKDGEAYLVELFGIQTFFLHELPEMLKQIQIRGVGRQVK